MNYMVQLRLWPMAVAILRNQVHRFLGGATRGGHRIAKLTDDKRRQYANGIYQTLSPYLGKMEGSVGLEVGPGDNLDVCRRCLATGCRKMYAVEKYSRPAASGEPITLIPAEIENCQLPEVADFAYSNDVFEHVRDVPVAMKAIFNALRPGGRFVSSIDLRGHNVFNKPQRPLDFLTCPDWLWNLMFSHIVTTNRVRAHEFIEAAESTGFRILRAEALASAEQSYIDWIRPHFLPRFRTLSDHDLRILQLLLVVERPADTSQPL